MKKYFLLILFFFIIFPFRVQGEKLILKKVKSTEDLAGYFKFFEDKNKTLSVEDIQKLKEEKFSQITRETINFGLTDSINWVRLDIENQTNSNDWLLELTAPSIDSINYYFIKDENIFHSIAGDEEKYKNAMVLPNFIYFPVPLKPGESGRIYISLKSHEIVEAPIRITTEAISFHDKQDRIFFQGLYFGIILIMTLFNLFLYFNLKDSAYLFYVLYVLGIGYASAYFSGYVTNSTLVYYSNVSNSFTSIFAILFTVKFLGTNLNNKIINLILLYFLLAFVLYIILDLLGFRNLNTFLVYNTSVALTFVLLFSGAYIYIRKKFIPARYYFISWLAFIFGLNIQFARAFGLLPYNQYTSHAMQFGNVAEILLLSFALADRINQYKKEFEDSRERAIAALNSNRRLIEEQNKVLEEKVTKRTQIIEEQKKELEEKNSLLLREIELAGKFQKTLLPNRPEVIPRIQLGFLYEPMLGVGGDFIDILYEKESNYLGLFICDVTGHGITASLIASMVKISLQGWKNMIHSPSKIPEHIRANMKDKLDKNFLTSGICSLNLDTLELKYASAGHPSLIHIPFEESAKLVYSKGRVIGGFFSTDCQETNIILSRGDKIILYTDGIIEARNRRGEMLGEVNLIKKLEELNSSTPREMAGELSAFMKNYTGGKEPEDDMTLLILEVEY